MSIRLIVFDFDGTLFDTRGDIRAAINRARQSFGLEELDQETITGMVGHGIRVLAERAFQGSGIDPGAALERVAGSYRAHPADFSQLYPGVREVLSELTQILTIVSNKPADLIQVLLSRHALASYFAFVAGGDTFERLKPDPMAVEYIQNRFQVRPLEMLVVGDHTPDLEMARAAGIRSVYCRYGFFGDRGADADFQIDSITQLPSLLKTLA